ncbi:unnamed protein product [Periconia digitata]|uniref:Uncharacterized protein n=1 Tax=Periconia digitata TaxID=1303443 RepID=A0A9W4XNZ2_9PLEO|nr:unnamed protein product [Periconia digitata]
MKQLAGKHFHLFSCFVLISFVASFRKEMLRVSYFQAPVILLKYMQRIRSKRLKREAAVD